MRAIALSLLLIFTTFTVVLCTYFVWQDAEFTVVMPIEEEEDHSKSQSVSLNVVFNSLKNSNEYLYNQDFTLHLSSYMENNYEDVHLNTLFSPPDHSSRQAY